MKTRKNIFTSCNLVLFISSLLFASLIGLFSTLPASFSSNKQEISAKQSVEKGDCSQFVFEENETETENGFEVQALALPFHISFFQFEISVLIPNSVNLLAEKLTNPIYLSVCNFRI